MNAIEKAINSAKKTALSLPQCDQRADILLSLNHALQSMRGEAEPVAYLDEDGRVVRVSVDGSGDGGFVSPNRAIPDYWRPLYTHPQSPMDGFAQCIKIVESYQVPVGNSVAGEIACDWTMDALKEIRGLMIAASQQPTTRTHLPEGTGRVRNVATGEVRSVEQEPRAAAGEQS
jgi:hypothetical protein